MGRLWIPFQCRVVYQTMEWFFGWGNTPGNLELVSFVLDVDHLEGSIIGALLRDWSASFVGTLFD